LQGSGRVCHYPNVGDQVNHIWSLVIKVKSEFLLEFLDVRSALELSSVPIVIKNLRPDDLISLHKLTQKMLECVKRNEPFNAYDREFHCTLFKCTGNSIFQQVLTAFWDLCERTIQWPENGNSEEVVQQHVELLEAFACRNEELATQLLSKQFVNSRNQIALALLNRCQNKNNAD